MQERTLAIIKPREARSSKTLIDILQRICDAGLKVTGFRKCTFSQKEAEEFLAEHEGRWFHDPTMAMYTSADSIRMCLEGDNAIKVWRELIGPTDPQEGHAGQIRFDYGRDELMEVQNLPTFKGKNNDNVVHGSSDAQSAERELKILGF